MSVPLKVIDLNRSSPMTSDEQDLLSYLKTLFSEFNVDCNRFQATLNAILMFSKHLDKELLDKLCADLVMGDNFKFIQSQPFENKIAFAKFCHLSRFMSKVYTNLIDSIRHELLSNLNLIVDKQTLYSILSLYSSSNCTIPVHLSKRIQKHIMEARSSQDLVDSINCYSCGLNHDQEDTKKFYLNENILRLQNHFDVCSLSRLTTESVALLALILKKPALDKFFQTLFANNVKYSKLSDLINQTRIACELFNCSGKIIKDVLVQISSIESTVDMHPYYLAYLVLTDKLTNAKTYLPLISQLKSNDFFSFLKTTINLRHYLSRRDFCMDLFRVFYSPIIINLFKLEEDCESHSLQVLDSFLTELSMKGFKMNTDPMINSLFECNNLDYFKQKVNQLEQNEFYSFLTRFYVNVIMRDLVGKIDQSIFADGLFILNYIIKISCQSDWTNENEKLKISFKILKLCGSLSQFNFDPSSNMTCLNEFHNLIVDFQVKFVNTNEYTLHELIDHVYNLMNLCYVDPIQVQLLADSLNSNQVFWL